MRKNGTKNHIQRSNQGGFSLLEVMISVVILGIGVLGMAYLQQWGTRFGQESYYRSQATIIAAELMERIRSNALHAPAGRDSLDMDDYTNAPATTADTDCSDSVAAGATSPEIDKNCFYSRLANTLPAGNGLITVQDTPANTKSIEIEVVWNDRNLVVSNPGSTATPTCSLPRKDSSGYSWGHSSDPGACLQVQKWVIEI